MSSWIYILDLNTPVLCKLYGENYFTGEIFNGVVNIITEVQVCPPLNVDLNNFLNSFVTISGEIHFPGYVYEITDILICCENIR